MTTDVSITELARTAGLETDWTDAGGIARRVDDDALVALVDALGWPCGTAAQRGKRRRARRRERGGPAHRHRRRRPAADPAGRDRAARRALPDHARSGRACRRARGRRRRTRHAAAARDPRLPRARRRRPAHRATIAPPRAQPVDPRAADAGGRWGIAAQLYSLRRAGDGAGDYTALARLAAHAARHGAQAVAISPTHAAFPALPAHDSPYSPSSRRWHNVAYLDCDAVPAPLPCLTQPVPRPTHR